MHEMIGDIWRTECDALCITTNGIVKKNGELVMGAGIAKQCYQRYPEVAKYLGHLITTFGNSPYCASYRHYVGTKSIAIFSFPTKHHFKDKSDITLIARSAKVLVCTATVLNFKKIILPKPGCLNGGLDWETEVKPVLAPILDDRFYIIDRR